jgi:hypothetical protein
VRIVGALSDSSGCLLSAGEGKCVLRSPSGVFGKSGLLGCYVALAGKL